MKKKGKRRIAALLAVLAMMIGLLALEGAAAGEQEASQHGQYYYVLEKEDSLHYKLYVERERGEDRLLHTGAISLAVAQEYSSYGNLKFVPADSWQIIAPDAAENSGNQIESGRTGDGQNYISFFWYWGKTYSDLPEESGNRQLLGQLEVPLANMPEDCIELLPWPETATGRDQVDQWQSAQTSGGDTEALLDVIKNTWRMPRLESPGMGYYQGYYADQEQPDQPLDTAPVTGVDLIAKWSEFTIGAYAPQRQIELTFYQERDGQQQKVATAVRPGQDSGIGHFRGQIKFSELQYQNPDGTALGGGLPDGIYQIEIRKLSHVVCTLENAPFEGGACLLLKGIYLELPCGDVDGGADQGHIGQMDYAKLSAPFRFGKAMKQGEELYDLNGDERVDQKDLSILIAPANYNKKDFSYQAG